VTAIISAAPKVEQSLEIRVTDNGPGISSEDATRVFEPFFTTKPQGTGLGLAVVKAITKAHGGVVWLVPDQECGATFVLSLPIGTKTVRKRKQRRASLKVASRRS
jgi:signal transduction histidine kinase